MPSLASLCRLNLTTFLVAALVLPSFARADQPTIENTDPRAQISDEIHRVEVAVSKLKGLKNQKAMSGRGWTALDDLVVGAAMTTAAAGVFGMMTVLPKIFPKAPLLQPGYLLIPKAGTAFMAFAGVMNLAQGALVYPFVSKEEMGTTPQLETVEVDVNHIDIDSLTLPQAEALLARMKAAREELDQSTEALTSRLTPKLGSRLAFISSNVVSTGIAIVAIGGGLYLVTSQAHRFAPTLMRIEGLRGLGEWIADNQLTLHMVGVQQGFGIAVQGVVQTLTGYLIKLFVPKGTPQASPVN